MTILDDVKNVSETVIDKLADKFADLPRPLLAAIGAGDLAVEQLVKLRGDLAEKFEDTFGDVDLKSVPSADDVKHFAGDLPGKASKIASDVAHNLQDFAGQVPDKAQQLIAELPAKAQEMANALSPDKLKSTVESYTQMVAMVFGSLADRGGETVAKVRDEDKAEKAAKAEKPAKAEKVAEKPAAKKAAAKPAAKKPAAKSAPKKPAAKKPATKPAATKPAAAKSATAAKPASAEAAKAEPKVDTDVKVDTDTK